MKHAFIDKFAYQDSQIHRLNPSIKMVLSLGFLIGLVGCPTIIIKWIYVVYTGLLFLVLYLARLPLLAILKKVLVILPLALFVVILNILLNGFSQQALHIAIKTCYCLLTTIILISTTKVHEILQVLKTWHIPNIIIMILSFLYRYFYLLIDEFGKMEQALQTRNVGLNRRQKLRLLAHILSTMFLKTYERAESVYYAMVMRGYNGENL